MPIERHVRLVCRAGEKGNVCRHCGASLRGVVRGAGRKLGTVPEGFCNSECEQAFASAPADVGEPKAPQAGLEIPGAVEILVITAC